LLGPFVVAGGCVSPHAGGFFADSGIIRLHVWAAETVVWEVAVDELETGFDGEHERRGVAAEMAERRQHKRYAVDAMAEVLVLDGTVLFRGRVLDISVAGCYIETKARLHLASGTPVEMAFRAKDVVFRLEATCRSVRPGKGAGFRFSNLSAKSLGELEALIAELNSPG
jgi:hypothetical protein